MTDTSKINCPNCSAAMNHHAVKLEYDSDEPADPVFGGVAKNVYTCSECGAIEMTPA
ncbi:MAG: hypothetical protein ACR2H6_03245 [Pyrinomonadaceae bacterium]